DQRKGQAKHMSAEFFTTEVHPGRDIPRLITATHLEFAVEFLAQMIEVKSLEEHVTKLRVTDPRFAVFHASADAFLRDDTVHGKVFADIAQEFEVIDRSSPFRVV